LDRESLITLIASKVSNDHNGVRSEIDYLRMKGWEITVRKSRPDLLKRFLEWWDDI